MIASRRLASLFIALAASLLSSIAAAQATALPADAQPFPPEPKPCLLVSGDGATSSVLADSQADKGWVEIDRQVTSALVEALKGNGYATSSFFIEPEARNDKSLPLMHAMMDARCARLLQVSHTLGDDATGPYFRFTFSMTHMVSSASGAARGDEFVALNDYARSYRYARTPAVMDSWRTGTFANTVFADLRASGRAEYARLGTLPSLAGAPPAPGGAVTAMAAPTIGAPAVEGVSYPPDAKPCLLVNTGAVPMSTVSADPAVDKYWVEIDRQIMSALVDGLTRDGYGTVYVFVDTTQRDAQPPRLSVGLHNSRCADIVLIAHQIGQDGDGPYFSFAALVSHYVTPSGAAPDAPPKAVLDFTKVYRYPQTQQDVFRPSELAASITSDLEANGQIGFARRGTLPKQAEAPPPVPAGEKPVDPALLHRSYDLFMQKWPTMQVKDVHVRQILAATEADARVALARLQAGESFDAVALALSTDAASRDKGGDVGWQQVAAFPIDVARMVQSLEPKGLAQRPVHSPAGWHVVEVLDVGPAQPPTFEAVEGKMAAAIRAARAARAAQH